MLQMQEDDDPDNGPPLDVPPGCGLSIAKIQQIIEEERQCQAGVTGKEYEPLTTRAMKKAVQKWLETFEMIQAEYS